MMFPIVVKEMKGEFSTFIVELWDATKDPLYVMAVAWETMLGDPRSIIETGEYENITKEILKAKHKTVFEYISLSIRLSYNRFPGINEHYVYGMASCRAGFSVSFIPMNKDRYISVEIGCNFRSLLDWVRHGVDVQSDAHKVIMPMIVKVVETYNPVLGKIIYGELDGM